MHMPTALAAFGLILALMAAVPAQAQPDEPQTEDCEGPIRMTARSYTHNGVEYQAMPSEVEAGSELTANFRLEGCGELQLTLVSYQAEADFELTTQELFDVDTQTFAQGNHSLTVTVPPCFVQIDFAYGAAIEQFTPPNGTYHGQGRIIAAVMATTECGVPEATLDICPPTIDARAQANGTVELSWNATGGATTQALYRATGDGDLQLLQELDGTASGAVDATAKGGAAYRYELVAVTELEMQPCASVQVGSVPDFPTAVGAVLAVAIGTIGYAALRRRG